MSALTGQHGGDERVADEGDGGELRRAAGRAERLAAVGDEPLAVPQQHLLHGHDDHAEHEQGRAERGGAAVLDRGLAHVGVDLGGDDVDAGGSSQQQRAGELAEPEQQGDAAAVQQGGAQQWQGHPEEHAELRRAGDLGRFEVLGADALEAGGDEEVDERRQPDPGDDDDPRHRVDVDRAFLEVRPPRQVPQGGVEVAGTRREQERPPDDAGDRRHHDRQDGDDAQDAQPRWEPGGGPGQQRAEDEGDGQRAQCQADRVGDRASDPVGRERRAVAGGTIGEGFRLEPHERTEHEVADRPDEGDEPERLEQPAGGRTDVDRPCGLGRSTVVMAQTPTASAGVCGCQLADGFGVGGAVGFGLVQHGVGGSEGDDHLLAGGEATGEAPAVAAGDAGEDAGVGEAGDDVHRLAAVLGVDDRRRGGGPVVRQFGLLRVDVDVLAAEAHGDATTERRGLQRGAAEDLAVAAPTRCRLVHRPAGCPCR